MNIKNIQRAATAHRYCFTYHNNNNANIPTKKKKMNMATWNLYCSKIFKYVLLFRSITIDFRVETLIQ